MNFLSVCFAISMSIVLVSGQYFGNNYGGYGFNSINGDFGGPSAFGGSGPTNVRDPRQNRGPVVFPAPPQDGPMETSGVIVGASGFGFVPPNGAESSRNFASSRFNNRYFNQFGYY